jgi:glycosyltransferase involved in cell wall biosynthesis
MANILARLSTPRKVRQFNSIHAISSMAAYDGNKLVLIIERLTYRKRHHIIAVSGEVLADFKKHVGIRGASSVLYNFIDDSFFEKGPRQHFSTAGLKLVAVGNLRHQKNYPYLLESFKKLPPGISLDIYGEGIMRNELQEEIDRHQLNIRLLGLRDDLVSVLPSYDAFVMSSFFEGQPLSLLEAMAVGLPSFLADIPVLREVAGDHAIYFDNHDPESFRAQIKKAQAGEVDLEAIAAAGYKRVNEFAHREQYIEKLEALYLAP